MSRFLEDLRSRYPKHQFSQDPISGRVEFVHQEMCTWDPFLSECGRFRLTPSYYGLRMSDALDIWKHNQDASHAAIA